MRAVWTKDGSRVAVARSNGVAEIAFSGLLAAVTALDCAQFLTDHIGDGRTLAMVVDHRHIVRLVDLRGLLEIMQVFPSWAHIPGAIVCQPDDRPMFDAFSEAMAECGLLRIVTPHVERAREWASQRARGRAEALRESGFDQTEPSPLHFR